MPFPDHRRATAWLWITILLLLGIPDASAWEYHPEAGTPLHTSYTAAQSGVASYNTQMAEDRAGNLYVANDRGVMKFDGITWSTLPATGLSQYTVGVAIDSAGRIWAAQMNSVGYYAITEQGEYVYTDLSESIRALPGSENFGQNWWLHCSGESTYLITSFNVLRWDGQSWRSWSFQTPRRILQSFVDGVLYIYSRGSGLYRLDGDQFTRLTKETPEVRSGIISILPDTGKGLLCVTVSNGLFHYRDQHFERFNTECDELINDPTATTYNAALHPNGTILLGTADHGILIVNADGQLVAPVETQNSAVLGIRIQSDGTIDLENRTNGSITVVLNMRAAPMDDPALRM